MLILNPFILLVESPLQGFNLLNGQKIKEKKGLNYLQLFSFKITQMDLQVNPCYLRFSV